VERFQPCVNVFVGLCIFLILASSILTLYNEQLRKERLQIYIQDVNALGPRLSVIEEQVRKDENTMDHLNNQASLIKMQNIHRKQEPRQPIQQWRYNAQKVEFAPHTN